MTAFQSVLGSAQKPPTGSQGPFTTLEVVVGSTANQALRCQVLDEAGVPIAATRGVNFDVRSFTDLPSDSLLTGLCLGNFLRRRWRYLDLRGAGHSQRGCV